MAVQTKPILVHCVNCVAAASDNTGTIVAGIGVAVAVIGVIIAIAAYKVATRSRDIAQDSLTAAQKSLNATQDTLNIARQEHAQSVVEHQEFLRQLQAHADFAVTAELLPDGGDTYILTATAAILRVQVGLQNTGDREAGETRVEVLVPGGLRNVEWTDSRGARLDRLSTSPGLSEERLPLPQGGEAPAQVLSMKLPRVPRNAPEQLWIMFQVESAPAEILLRIKARSDDLAEGNNPVVHEFPIHVHARGT